VMGPTFSDLDHALSQKVSKKIGKECVVSVC